MSNEDATSREITHPDQEKGFKIIVNARQKIVDAEELSFGDIVALAFDHPPKGNAIEYTVVYRDGGGRKTEGSLIQGQRIKVQNGTVIDVTATDKS